MSFEFNGQRRSEADGLLYLFHARYSIVGPRVVWEANVHHDSAPHCLLRGAAAVASGQSEETATTAVLQEVCAAIDQPGRLATHSTELLS
jgi:hypothetical protein